MSSYSLTRSRTFQYVGILAVFAALATGYWYFAVRAGVKTNTASLSAPGYDTLAFGLAGYWKLDENTGTSAADSSTNGNTGTLTNGPTWTTGQIGSAVNFDGTNDYIAPSGYVPRKGSISAWVNTTEALSTCEYSMVFSTEVPGSHAQLQFNSCSVGYNRWEFLYRGNYGTYADVGGPTYTSTSEYQGWHHLTATWDDATGANIYVDGTLVGSSTTTTDAMDTTTAATVRIGSGNGVDYYTGKIDEVRLYDRILSPDEIASLYRLTTPTGVDTSLKGYWSFNGDAISGTTAYDRSGVGNSGTLTGGPAVEPGRLGQALSFDNVDDYVIAGSPAATDDLETQGGGGMTASAWIYPESGGTFGGVIVGKRAPPGAGDGDWAFTIHQDGDALKFYKSYSTTSLEAVTASGSIALNRWQYVTVTWSGTAARSSVAFYIDGVLVPTSTSGGSDGVGTKDSDASENISISSQFVQFDGLIDEVRLHNRILSAAEVKAFYGAGAPDKANTSASQAQGTGNLDSGLAGYWKLDENTGTSASDASTNGSTGTLTNGPTWTTGQIGSAVDFDGTNDHISVPGSSALNVTRQITLSTWFRPDVLPSYGNEKYFFRNDVSGSQYYSFRLDGGPSGDYQLWFTPGSGGDHNGSETFSLTASSWYHAAVTHDSTSGKVSFYINGQLVSTSTDTVTGGYISGTGTLYIGSAASSAYFNGALDEARIYNRTLSADEVAQLYRLTAPTGVDTGLKGYWSFNGQDVSGTTAYDRSGAGNNGTITNSPAVKGGRVGQALDFFPNGSDTDAYITMDDPASGILDFGSGDFSLGFWMKGRGYNSQGSGVNIPVGKKNINSPNSAGYSFMYASDNILAFVVGNGTTDFSAVQSVATANDNQWHHYVGVRSGGSIALYVDGVMITTTTSVSGSTSNGDSFSVGSSPVGSDPDLRNVDGLIDEVRVYNRALSAGEIKAQYDAAAPDKTNTSASTPQGTGRLDSGLIGYWKLDEGSGTSAADASSAGTTGTLTGGPTWTTGRIGSAVDFDGTNDYIDLGTPAVLDVESAHTIAAWVKTDVTNTSQSIFVSGSAACCGMEAQLRIEYNVGGGTYQFQFSHTDQSSALISDLPTDVQTGTWYHVVGTWDGAGVRKLYVDGALSASDTGLASMTSEYNNEARIGYNHSITSEYFNGMIDEVRIYNRELAGEEISNLYQVTAPTGTDTSLKGYWSFNGQDISGTTAYDRSGTGNDGTLTNGPAVKWGKLGQALQFDGTDDYVSYANNIAFDSNDFSIASWFRLNGDAGGASGEGTIFSQRVDTLGDANPTVNMMIRNDDDLLRAQIRDSVGALVEVAAPTALVSGQWYHGVIVKTSTALTVYLDGVSGGSTTHSLSGDFDTGAVHRFIGKHRYEGGDVGFFNGVIDEVRVYSRALSASEIKTLYSSGK